jgi:hypothetical protein
MWQSYGDNSTGVCIHFSTVWPSPFALCQKVDYEFVRAPIWFPRCLGDHETARRSMLVKTRRWRHELEFRFIRYPDTSFGEIDFHIAGQHGEFPPKVLIGVTVGHAMPRSLTLEILNSARKHHPPLPVFRMRKNVWEEPKRLY